MEKNKVRYKELREANGKTQEEISSYLDCTPKAYRSYEQGKQDIKLEYLIKLSELYHVSLEYILGIDDNEHIHNEEISKITGLSNRSIEVLRELESDKSRSSNNVRSFGLYTQSGDLSHRNIDFINFVLEEYFDTWLKDVKQIKADNTIKIEKKERNGFKTIPILSSVFMYMYHCIFAGDMKCIIRNSQDNVSMSVKDMKDFFISGKPLEEEQKELTFYDTYSGLRITEQAINLWNTYNMNIVTKWLNDKREEVAKNGKH